MKKISRKDLLLLLLFFSLYFSASSFFLSHNKTVLSPMKTQFQVQYSDEFKIDGDSFRAVVTDRKTNEKLILNYKISSKKEKSQLQQQILLKKVCIIKGNLITPSTSRNLNAFNYKEYLKQKKIFWELHATNLNLEGCKKGNLSLIDNIKLLRIKGILLIENNFTKETAPLAGALIFGTRDLLSEETVNAYQKLGVIHLISISGLHVALLIGLIFYLGIRFGAVREKLTKTLLLILPIYAILTGATPPVNRAVIMTMIMLLVTNINPAIKLKSMDGLCISFLLLAFLNPYNIYNIGFQLSYMITFSLLLSFSIVSKYHLIISKMLITSYISQVSALPFLLYHFYEIPLISCFANLLFIPLYSFIFLPGLILLFIIQFLSNDLFQLLSIFLSYTIEISNKFAHMISSLSWTRLVVGKPSILLAFLYLGCILFAFYSWEKSNIFRLAIALPWILLCLHFISPQFSSKGEVTIIDVGQGDSIFIKLPYNKGNYLIDTGGNISFPASEWKRKKNKYDVGKDVVVPFLKSKGIHRLDLLIFTHGDMDHIGGSISLLKEISVKRILMPAISSERSPFETKIIKMAREKNIEISLVFEGVKWKKNNNQFFILSPPPNYLGDKNGGSIVLFANIAGVKWLFTGDLGKEGERHIIEKYPQITIDILKVGHHGSRTSSSEQFINYYHPKYSIISVGNKNSFGHPHTEVLEILNNAESEIFRTDYSGGISYYFRRERGTFFKTIP